jgi:hypothetical protein
LHAATAAACGAAADVPKKLGRLLASVSLPKNEYRRHQAPYPWCQPVFQRMRIAGDVEVDPGWAAGRKVLDDGRARAERRRLQVVGCTHRNRSGCSGMPVDSAVIGVRVCGAKCPAENDSLHVGRRGIGMQTREQLKLAATPPVFWNCTISMGSWPRLLS